MFQKFEEEAPVALWFPANRSLFGQIDGSRHYAPLLFFFSFPLRRAFKENIFRT